MPDRRTSGALAVAKRRLGPGLRRFQRRLAQLAFDRGGLDTVEPVSAEALGFGHYMHPYKASGRFFLRRALRPSEVRPSDVFIDLGSGKGRVVYLAARYRFARVIGVELSEELNAIARANLERLRHKLKCQSIEIVTADLTDYEIPDDVTFIYMFNPLDGPLFSAMLNNVLASLDRRPRRLRLIYMNPEEAAKIEETGRFHLVKRSHGLRRDLPPTLHIYETSPGEPSD